MPDVRLPSQPWGITALSPVPVYTACWQRHVCVCVCESNLLKVVTWQQNGRESKSWPVSFESSAFTITPLGHTLLGAIQKCCCCCWWCLCGVIISVHQSVGGESGWTGVVEASSIHGRSQPTWDLCWCQWGHWASGGKTASCRGRTCSRQRQPTKLWVAGKPQGQLFLVLMQLIVWKGSIPCFHTYVWEKEGQQCCENLVYNNQTLL